MPTLLLVRHGRTTANTAGVLAGRTAGVALDDVGRGQAIGLGLRLAKLPLRAVVTSPLQRCRETTDLLLEPQPDFDGLKPVDDDRLTENHYGDWTGRPLRELAKDPLWPVVQAHPSAVTFPGEAGESIVAMQARALTAVREHDARVHAEFGPDALWLAVTHGDVIKAILADAAGMHLDSFQRLHVDPGSLSVIRYTPLRPFVLRMNDTGGDVTSLVPPKRRRRRASSDAVVGGETGGDEAQG